MARGGEARQQLQVLARLSQLVSSSLDVDRAFRGIAEAVADLLEAPGVFFWTADEAMRRLDLRLVVPASLGTGYPRTTMSYDEGIIGRVARERAVLHMPDVDRNAEVLVGDWWKLHGVTSALVVPIIVDDALLGVLSIIARTPFREEDMALAEGLAAHAAAALRNAAVLTRSERRRQQAEALAEVSSLLSQSLDPAAVGQRVTESVCRLLDARSAVIYRFTATGGLSAETVSSAAEFPWMLQLDRHVGIAGLALRERRPVATSDMLDDARLEYSGDRREIFRTTIHRALLAVSLVAQGREYGVLAVGDYTGRQFDDDDMRLTQAFADQAAVALENARLYGEASRQAERMRALAEVERLISETLDADLITRRIVETMRSLLGSRLAALYRAEGDDFVLKAIEGTGGPTIDVGMRFPPGTGLIGVVVRERHAAQSSNVLEDPRIDLPPDVRARMEQATYRAVLLAPLMVNDRVIGILNVGDDTGRVYDDDEVRVVQALADQTVRALENARLYGEARAAAQALRENEAVLERALEVGQIGSWTAGVGPGATLTWSKEVCRIFGVDPTVLTGGSEDFFGRVHPEDVPRIEAAREQAFASGERFLIDHRVIWPDGTVRWVHERADVERDAQGRPVRLIGVAQDITERKQAEEALQTAEEQLRQSQKMDAIGRLAGGVAHDFNNLLSIITGRSELLLRNPALIATFRRDVDLIHRTADRAASLTRQLLAFSRKQMLQPKVLDLNTVVASMGRMLRRVIGEDVELVIVARPALARVNADPGQIEQVILNLAVNARDAMPDGGRLTIETSQTDLDADYARRHTGVAAGRYVMLAVTDTGVGMDATVRERIFEPFFTTKEVGKGTGLGLSTVYGIVQQSGGAIWVYSEPGQGSTFKIYLPSVAEQAEAEEAPQAPPRGGSETVLLCEDEPDLRELTREVLEEFGYRVLEASDGRHALEVSASHTGPIHLLLTDVVMPRMNGGDLAAQLTRERPVRVLYMSGYTETGIVRGPDIREAAFLQKPFSPTVLARTVREVLDAV